MEIERKWMVDGWPSDCHEPKLPLLYTEYQEQGYVHTDAPIVRIRIEARTLPGELPCVDSKSPVTDAAAQSLSKDETKYVLCFKSEGLLSRKEIEQDISENLFLELKDLIQKPLIRKVRRVYLLPDGLHLEVNLVDEGLSTEFMYAEVEFASVEQADAWNPADLSLGSYLADDVTSKPGQSMSAYWQKTRNETKPVAN